MTVPDADKLPTVARLNQNYSNPFSIAIDIRYELRQAANVNLKVSDIAGRQVATLVEGQPASYYPP